MEPRPKIRPELSPADRIIEIAGWLALSLLWILILYNYGKMPGSVPVHFNATGKVDSYGGKATIFVLPALGTALFIGMTILNRFPWIFNYPVKLTEENAMKQYTMATRLIRVLKLAILLIFSVISYNIITIASEKLNGDRVWMMPFIILLIFIPLGLYLYKSFKSK